MSLYNFNSSNKLWKMYTNTLSSINGDPLTIKPYDGQNLALEVSGNNNIIIRKGCASYNLSNLITGTTTFVPSIYDASFTNIDVSGNLNPLTDASGSLGTSIKSWGNAYIRDISTTNISIDGNVSISGDISNIRQIIPQLTNDISTSLGTTSNIWQRAYINDLSNIVTINGTSWPPVGTTGAQGPNGPAGLFGLVVPPLKSMDISTIAFGGTLIPNNTYMIHRFTTVGTTTFTVNSTLSIDYLVVGGGGSGGVGRGGGGGGGGVKTGKTTLLPGTYTITVGAGGASASNDQQGFDGGSSSIGTLIVASGGGGGGGWTIQSGRLGGSGGGMSAGSGIIGYGSGILGEGFAGSVRLDTSTGGGGGGAGAAASGKNGAFGIVNEITGTAEFYAGGGGAGANTSNVGVANGGTYAVANGTYGGGNGSYTSGTKPLYTDALPNTGGGGGGGEGYAGPSGAGGSGIVIIRYDKTIINSKITTTSRIYQNICGDISWNAVNGYYGLAKDAYPALNSLSSGAKAVSSWTQRTTGVETTEWRYICWSAQRRLFVAVASSGVNKVMISSNGINWTPISVSTVDGAITSDWMSVCWSQQLSLFVAVAKLGTNRVMASEDGITWTPRTSGVEESGWHDICWSTELRIFVAVANSGTYRAMTSRDGIVWTRETAANSELYGVCWSAELGLFVAVGDNLANRVMISSNGKTWRPITITQGLQNNGWLKVCWSAQLGLFAAVAWNASNTVMISNDGINWTPKTVEIVTESAPSVWINICWSAELSLFIAVAESGTYRLMTSNNGLIWTKRTTQVVNNGGWNGICWSPELGIAVAVAKSGLHRVMTSSLKGRPPTSYNMFDSSFNSIDETGKWTFENVFIRQELMVNATVYYSDDRIKHNEININNGLDIIDKLTPKFYQKTQVLLDASYTGDLGDYAWVHETGLIAQELLQISDLSYVVSGGDYYEQTYNLITQTNDLTNVNYEISNNTYDSSNANYEINNNTYEINKYYKLINANYEASNNLIAQPYNVNYNSVFVYGLAAIKELHAKVKAHEASILNQKNIINSLITKIETLENKRTIRK